MTGGQGTKNVTGGNDATRELAAALRWYREHNGMSVRVLARKLGMSAHSGLADYESGRRIPPEDLIAAYERVFGLTAGELRAVRARAFAERAERRRRANETPSGRRDMPGPADGQATIMPGRRADRRTKHKPVLLTVAALAVCVIGATVAVLAIRPAAAGAGRGHSATPVSGASGAGPHSSAPPASAGPVPDINRNNDGVVEPVRRTGTVVLTAGEVIDLDSPAPSWGLLHAPRDNPSDLEFQLSDRSLTGIENANLAVIPPSSQGNRAVCGRLEDYGVELGPRAMKPGAMFCVITDQHRYTLGRITNVRYDPSGLPYQVTVEIRVWQARDAS